MTSVDSNGNIGNWTDSSTMPTMHYLGFAFRTSTRVYQCGGLTLTAGAATANVYYATINGDGTISNFITDTSLPSTVAKGTEAIVTNNRVWFIGGDINTADTGKIFTAPIDINGIVGIWQQRSLGFGVKGGFAFITSSRLYIVGFALSGAVTINTYWTSFNGGKNDYIT